MTLRGVIKAVIKANHLSSFFAEPVTFTPKATGTPRTVTMSIEPQTDRDQDGLTEDRRERIKVKMLTDVADADVGGVAQLFIGDKLVRASTYDPDSTPFIFNGEIEERSETTIVAIFSRYGRTVQGRGN